jgi:hypothetical protein
MEKFEAPQDPGRRPLSLTLPPAWGNRSYANGTSRPSCPFAPSHSSRLARDRTAPPIIPPVIHSEDLIKVLGAIALAVLFVAVIRWRRRTFVDTSAGLAEQEVCEHLRPALDYVLANGCRITRVGQKHPEMPLEVHVHPAFDPKAVLETLKLEPPVYLSERNVLYCKDDWCELHPKA